MFAHGVTAEMNDGPTCFSAVLKNLDSSGPESWKEPGWSLSSTDWTLPNCENSSLTTPWNTNSRAGMTVCISPMRQWSAWSCRAEEQPPLTCEQYGGMLSTNKVRSRGLWELLSARTLCSFTYSLCCATLSEPNCKDSAAKTDGENKHS